MIYYFSATGNSHHVAARLSDLTMEILRSIGDCDPKLEVPLGESVGFVFPVHAWGVATPMADFINAFPDSFWEDLRMRGLPVWCVMTCGDDVARTPEMFSKLISSHGLGVMSMWSVIMPNTYVLLPGFDTDPHDLAEIKLADSESRIKKIAEGINSRVRVVDVTRGCMTWLKTKVVYPLFRKYGVDCRKWHVTDACVRCRICIKACPLGNVTMSQSGPVWSEHCCSCLACYHSCPRHAVEYGNVTRGKGQYYLPVPSDRES